jgi:DNA-binding NarL/FixJ family response regulator
MAPRRRISVALSRFEDIVGLGLRTLILSDDNLRLVVDDVTRGEVAGAIARFRPDVAVLNYGSLGAASELRDLHAQFPQTRLLVLANRPQPAESRQLLAFGATACLSKSTEARDVLHAIHLASRGLQVLPPSTLEAPAHGPDLLTAREAQVMELLQAGRSNAQIAHELHVSIETVRTHARRVYRKLGVATRRELRLGPGRPG